jgi:hypothetical protein
LRTLLSFVVIFGGLALGALACVASAILGAETKAPWSMYVGCGAFVAVIIAAIIVMAVIRYTMIRPEYIDEDHITLIGVDDRFVDEMHTQREERRSERGLRDSDDQEGPGPRRHNDDDGPRPRSDQFRADPPRRRNRDDLDRD